MSKLKNDPIVDVEEAFSKTELFLEENKKTLSVIVGAIIVIVGGFMAWKYWYIPNQNTEALKNMYVAEHYFQADSLKKAINGDGQSLGFKDIADQYSMTPAGNLAQYYLGVSYLKLGDYQKAIDHLGNYDGDDAILGPIALGASGDAYMQLGKSQKAVNFYLKAAEKNKNKFTTPIYLKKAGVAYDHLGDYNDAIRVFQQIKSNFPQSNEGRYIDKYIARDQERVAAK